MYMYMYIIILFRQSHQKLWWNTLFWHPHFFRAPYEFVFFRVSLIVSSSEYILRYQHVPHRGFLHRIVWDVPRHFIQGWVALAVFINWWSMHNRHQFLIWPSSNVPSREFGAEGGVRPTQHAVQFAAPGGSLGRRYRRKHSKIQIPQDMYAGGDAVSTRVPC